MRVTVKKWGNSASVRIPSAIMEAASLKLDQTVDVREEYGRLYMRTADGTHEIDDRHYHQTGRHNFHFFADLAGHLRPRHQPGPAEMCPKLLRTALSIYSKVEEKKQIYEPYFSALMI